MKHHYPTYRLLFVFLALLILVTIRPRAQGISYRAQSLYIYKFTRYVSWPATNQGDTLVIGVFGRSPIEDELRLMASLKRAAGNRPISIKMIEGLGGLSYHLSEPAAQPLHILYVPSSKSRQITAILNFLAERPILLVAERGGLARRGACINFMVTEEDILRFEYNQSRLTNLQLGIAQDLLLSLIHISEPTRPY